MQDISLWRGCAAPRVERISGTFARIEPYQERHSDALFEAIGGPGNEELWQFIPIGPFGDSQALNEALKFAGQAFGWRTLIIGSTGGGDVLGMASYMRVRPEHGSAEVGCIVYSESLKRTPIATDAMYLMARHLFEDLGYRRYEWKCDNNNGASKRAADRLGFQFEGVFRNDMVVKGRSRDTAWFSIVDTEWEARADEFERWLDRSNFDDNLHQKMGLADFRKL